MFVFDDLPVVDSFFGLDLKTGSMIIAVLGMVHPLAYGCSFFIPSSYLLITVWILVVLYFVASIGLFIGVLKDSQVLYDIWIWYAVIFVTIMLVMMVLLAIVYTSRNQWKRVVIVILGILWYILTIYFILVVNSHRKKLVR